MPYSDEWYWDDFDYESHYDSADHEPLENECDPYFGSYYDFSDNYDEVTLFEEFFDEASDWEAERVVSCPPGGIIGLKKDRMTSGKKRTYRGHRRFEASQENSRHRKYWRRQKYEFLNAMAAHAELSE